MTKALELPVAVVLPHMRGDNHLCHSKRGTGPCPHPKCPRGHDTDTYFVAELADPLPLDIEKLEAMPSPGVKRVVFRRREWRHGKWLRLAVFAWRRLEEPESGLPLDILRVLPGQYIEGSWFATDAEQKALDAGVAAERARIVEGLRRDGELLKKPGMSHLMEIVVGTILDNADKIERGHFSDTSVEGERE